VLVRLDHGAMKAELGNKTATGEIKPMSDAICGGVDESDGAPA